MFSFYPSHPQALRYSPPVYSVYPDDDLYSQSSPHSRLLVTNPGVRYRRAFSEYLAAQEEYNAVLRAREEAQLMRARAKAIRQERARLQVLARARREQEARRFKQGLVNVLAPRAAVSGYDDFLLHHVAVPLSEMLIPSCMDRHVSCANGASVKVCGVRFEYCLRLVLITAQAQRDAEEETNVNQPPSAVECECSVPNLESVLRERLQKIAGDEEVQDLAHAILRHLTSVTGGSPSAASSPEVGFLLHKCPWTITDDVL